MSAEILDAAIDAACDAAGRMQGDPMPTGAEVCAALAGAGYTVVSAPDVDGLAEALHRSQFVSQPLAAMVWGAVNEGERDRWRILARAAIEHLKGGSR